MEQLHGLPEVEKRETVFFFFLYPPHPLYIQLILQRMFLGGLSETCGPLMGSLSIYIFQD